MVTVVLRIVQRSPYVHMGKLFFVSSTPSVLQFAIIQFAICSSSIIQKIPNKNANTTLVYRIATSYVAIEMRITKIAVKN